MLVAETSNWFVALATGLGVRTVINRYCINYRLRVTELKIKNYFKIGISLLCTLLYELCSNCELQITC